jgi:hypothetical protein
LVKTWRPDENSTALPSGAKPRTTSGPGCQVRRVALPADGDGENVGVAVVLPTEGEYLVVRREDGARLDADVTGERRAFLPSRSATQRSSARAKAMCVLLTAG